MRLFAVRCIDDKQGVGFFWAKDLLDLWWLVDSIIDPDRCEYHTISGSAAVVWDKKGHPLGVHSGDDEEDDGEFQVLTEGIDFEGDFSEYIYGEVRNGWKPLPHAEEPGGGLYELDLELNGLKPRR